MSSIAILAIALLQLAQAPAGAKPAAPATPLSEVTVTAKPLSDESPVAKVERFTGTPHDIQMARWYAPVCPAVLGLDDYADSVLVGRIVAAARSVGLEAKTRECHTNILIFIHPDPAAVMANLLKERRENFGDEEPAAIRAALGVDRPVRWWMGTDIMQSDGEMPTFTLTRKGYRIPVSKPKPRSNRISATFRYDLRRAVLVVDAKKVDKDRLDALGDYLAMASLAQISDKGGFEGIDTVMNLFGSGARGEAVTGLTAWDRDFLQGLYGLSPDSYANAQRYGIVRAMERAETKR